MAAKTYDDMPEFKDLGWSREELCADEQTIYKGAMVCTLSTDGYLYDGDDVANYTFAGIAKEGADTVGEDDGDTSIPVAKSGRFKLALDAAASFTQADKGSVVTIKDNQTVSKASQTTNDVQCGIFLGFWGNDSSSGYGEILIDGYAK